MSESSWYERIAETEVQWDTNGYTIENLIASMTKLTNYIDLPITEEETRDLITLLELLKQTGLGGRE